MPGWAELLATLIEGRSLAATDTTWAMREIMSGEATPAQVAGFAVALRAKGETAEEVAGLVAAMLAEVAPLRVPGPAVDTCGTGGDRAHTVNISTMAAVVARGAGATVVKHGNRAASSACGSADLLEALGVVVDLAPDGVARCVAETGIGFCFAPVFHPALRHTSAARRELGIPTVFNFLGPLTNPALPGAQAVGVSDARMAGVVAGVLAARGVAALVFRGEDGLDELTTTTSSRVWVVAGGEVVEATLDPARLGFAAPPPGALTGGSAADNAEVARGVFGGARGPVRDAVLLNTAAALVALDGPRVDSLLEQLADGVARATASVDSGAAADALERWVAASRDAADA
ncbi:MAG TPA: anthranilate phosphoribosyltransferase [Mycobacteriales bacterium]|nr:anthranilate phosphoribosyltransferase [Mycobacteriales bacterium]